MIRDSELTYDNLVSCGGRLGNYSRAATDETYVSLTLLLVKVLRVVRLSRFAPGPLRLWRHSKYDLYACSVSHLT